MDRRRQAPATYDESVLQKSPDPNVWIGQQLEFYSDAYTRQERVTVSVCSFNVDSRKSTADLSTWLRLQNKPSIIAIGLQEVDMSANALLRGETEAMNTWRDLLCATVNADCDWGSASSSRTGQAPYTMIGARQMVGLFLTVFVLKPLLRFTSRIRMNTLATGAMMNTLGNKGAIALRLRIHRTRIVFITAHLAAHQHEVDRRNRDFNSIMSNLDFSREDTLGLSPPSSSAVALSSRTALAGEGAGVLAPWDHDYVFFFGDLNYRIDRYTYDQVVSLVKEQNYSALLKEDQLRRELVRGAPRFKGFQEAEHFSFPPTYRYDEGTSNFDTSEKRRIPAYTDRILWWLRPVRNMTPDRVKENVVLKHFTSFPEICSSDHKPISALFDLALNVEVETERSKIMSQLLNRVTDVGFERLLSPNIEVSTRNISFGVQSFGAYVEQVVVIENKGLSVTEVGIYVLDPKKAEEPSSSPSTTLKTDGNVEDGLGKTKLSFAGLANETCQIHTVRWVGVHPLDNFIFPGEFATFTIECQVDRSTMAFQEFKGPFIGIRQFLLRQVIVVQPRYGQPVMIPVEVLVPSSCFGNTLGNLVSIRPHRPCVEAYAKTHQLSSDSSAAGTDDKRTASVPKELWCLIDVLYRKFCKTPSLFLEIASEQELFAIRDYLDTSLSGPESVAHLETFSPHAIANAVTTFLQSLQVPVIPFELYHAVATANAPKHYTAIFEDMRSVHYNTFMYIVSFLRFLLTEKNRSFNGLSVEAITAGFGPILVQAPRSPSNPLYRSYSSDEHRSAVMNITGFLTWCLTAESLMELS